MVPFNEKYASSKAGFWPPRKLELDTDTREADDVVIENALPDVPTTVAEAYTIDAGALQVTRSAPPVTTMALHNVAATWFVVSELTQFPPYV